MICSPTDGEGRAVFDLFSNGAKTNRDEWVYDFNVTNLRSKALYFADVYNGLLSSDGESYDPAIKWSSTLRDRFHRNERIVYNDAKRIESLYRPFVVLHHYTDVALNDRLTRNHFEIFGSDLKHHNEVICFSGIASSKPFQILATDMLFGFDTLEKTQCLPLYRYTEDGKRVSNITQWGIDHINGHYRQGWRDDFETLAGPEGITAEQIFAYTYAVLHDPVYRHDYAVDLLREFPRLPLYPDFHHWADMGQQLLDLHVGFESAEPFALERVEKDGDPGKAALKADKPRGAIVLDGKTMLIGVPEEAWEYRLGSRSALEWVLDQYKEKTPRDPTVRDRFNTYHFADYKEQVIDLLQRVCTVSVKTVRIVDQLNLLSDIHQI